MRYGIREFTLMSRLRLFRAGVGQCFRLAALASKGEAPGALTGVGRTGKGGLGEVALLLPCLSRSLVNGAASVSQTAPRADPREALVGFSAGGALPRAYASLLAAAVAPAVGPPLAEASPLGQSQRPHARDDLPRPMVIDTLDIMRRFERAGMSQAEAEAIARSGAGLERWSCFGPFIRIIVTCTCCAHAW